jgi:pimeloyl-ACP methyl ester carboxylesterase
MRLGGPLVSAAITLAAAHPAAAFANTARLPRQLWRSRYAMLFQIRGLSEIWAAHRDFAYLETLWRRWAHPGWLLPALHLDEVKRVMGASWPAPLLHYRAMPFAGNETPLPQPTLYLLGARDGCVLPATAQGQERYFAGPFRSELIGGAGHFLHWEAPDLTAAKVVDWLRRHGQP